MKRGRPYQRIGQQIVESLSQDLLRIYPGNSGFSSRNLWLMRQFYIEYVNYTILQPLVAEIPWAHNIAVMSKVSDIKAREYYIKAFFPSAKVLEELNMVMQIELFAEE